MSDTFEKQFLELQKIFINNLSERKQRINDLFLQLNASRLEQNALENLHREVHNLSGASGCYQLTNLAEEARKVEDYLNLNANSLSLQADAWWQELETFIDYLCQLIEEQAKV